MKLVQLRFSSYTNLLQNTNYPVPEFFWIFPLVIVAYSPKEDL